MEVDTVSAALPFTVEEARERALANAMKAARIRTYESGADEVVAEHERLAATLREYARLREAVDEIHAIVMDGNLHVDLYDSEPLTAIRAIVERLNKEG